MLDLLFCEHFIDGDHLANGFAELLAFARVFVSFAVCGFGYALGLGGSFMKEGTMAAKLLPMAGLAASAILALLAAYLPSKDKTASTS